MTTGPTSTRTVSTRHDLTDAEFDIGDRLLREAGLPIKCPCLGCSHAPRLQPEVESVQCRKAEIIQTRRYMCSGLRARDLKRPWESFGNPDHHDTIVAYAENLAALVSEGIGLSLIGKVGTGKTSAATYLARQAIARYGSQSVTVATFPDTVAAYKDQRLADRLKSSRFLVLDEMMLGKSEAQSDLFDDRMSEIIVSRYAANHVTLITANYAADELEDHYPRMMSRLGEVNEPLIYSGPNYRTRGRPNVLAHGRAGRS